jgi:ferredoxin-type protein NapH
MNIDNSLSISNPNPSQTSFGQKIASSLMSISLLLVLIAWSGHHLISPMVMLIAAMTTGIVGALWYFQEEYSGKPEGIKNNNLWFHSFSAKEGLVSVIASGLIWLVYYKFFSQNQVFFIVSWVVQIAIAIWVGSKVSVEKYFQVMTLRGVFGWMLGILLTGFYVCLYWFPEYLQGLITLFDPLSRVLRAGKEANQWFVYSTFYTFLVVIMGVKMIYKYRHNRYQIFRTISVVFFQLGFGYLIPAMLVAMQQPEIFFHYFWPLSYWQGTPMAYEYYNGMSGMTSLGVFYFFFSIAMFLIGTPVLTYFYGKRWYCSWVCGCGGLAETAGDSFRQLSDKSLSAWKFERHLIYSILQGYSDGFYKAYSFAVGSAFSGVVGTGFYPILGNRSWCRFGCPMAAWLGLWQKYFSRFRITTNGGQCISCGNCSSACEMGIDVKAYAQKGQDIVRASCVGCGICSAVCPRGVLRLENGSVDLHERTTQMRTIHIPETEVGILKNFTV